jgi:hypothetical protein
MRLVLALLALAAAPIAAAAQSFAAPLQALPAMAHDVVTLDLEPVDALPDVAVLNGGHVTLLRALPGGGYEETDDIATGGFGGELRVTDIDLDGDDDLVLSRTDHLQVFLLEFGFQLFGWDYASSGFTGFQVDVGDLDSDGDTDIVVADQNFDRITVRLGLGSSGLEPPATYATGDSPADVALGDFDGDGVLDVITSDALASALSVRLGDGAGGFGPALPHALTGSPGGLALTDTNGDGRLDVIVKTPSGLAVLAGDGSGGLLDGLTLPVPPLLFDFAAHDMDGDGDEDLLYTAQGPGDALTVRLSTGDGDFEPPLSGFPGYSLKSLAIDDLDLDGRADIIAGTEATFVLMARGDGAGGFVHPGALDFPAAAELVSVADLNADGLSDLVSTPASAGVTEVRLGLGAGAFAPPVSSPGAAIDVARYGDFDGDGLQDLVTLADGGLIVRRSDGAGGLLPGEFAPMADEVMDVAVTDVDDDGDQDVVLLTATGILNTKQWIGTMLGDGTGGLGPMQGAIIYAFDAPPPYDRVKVGDVNGDGVPDAVVVQMLPGNLRVFLGDGTGSFAPGAVLNEYQLENQGQDSMALADLDGDDELDIVARRADEIRAWSGHGDGTFAASVTLTTEAAGGPSLAVADVDHDGFADVVFESYAFFGVLRGSAGGGFELTDYARPDNFPFGRIFVGALDGDAFPDVIGVETDGVPWPAVSTFTGVTLHRNLAASAQWADLGYGLAGTNGVPLLVGTGTLVAGSPGTLKLSDANPNKLAVLFISKQSFPAPFKGGILATVPPLISFMLRTSPSGTINLSWPHWPGGAPGSTWYFQYGIVDSGGPAGAALSNALRATQP